MAVALGQLPGYGPRWGPPALPASPSFTPPLYPSANSPYLYGSGLPQRYVRPRGAAPTRTGTTPPGLPKTPTLADLYQQLIGTIETPAQAQARVDREIAQWTTAQQKMLQDTASRQRADALAAMNAMSQAGAAAAAMSKGLIGAVGGEYNQAAQEIAGLAGGLTGSFNAATARDVKAQNAALGRVGSPALTEGGLGGYGGGLQAGVENYRGGTIPGQLMTSAGDAATFGLAGETAAQNLKTTQEAAAAYQSALHDINNAEMQAEQALAAGQMEKAHDWLQEADDARQKAISLASGLYTAQAGLTGTGTKPVTQRIGNQLYQYDSKTDRWVKVAEGPATGTATHPYTKTVDGSLYQWVPNAAGTGGRWVLAIRKPAGSSATKPITRTSRGILWQWDPASQTWSPAPGTPTQPKTAPRKGPSATTVTKALDLVKTWYYGTTAVGKPGSQKRVPAWQAPGFNENNPNTYGKSGWINYPVALANLTRMGFDRLTARNMLNQYWERGDQGRPIFSTEEQAALRQKFGNTPYDRMVIAIRKALDAQQFDLARRLISQVLSGQGFSGSGIGA